ncbi:MAG: sterol desaturase family protein [Myxococcota bacterium]
MTQPDEQAESAPSSRLEWIVARTIFPLGFGAAVYWAITRFAAGENETIAITLPLLSAYILVASLERLLYHERTWLHSNGDLKVDIGHALISGILTLGLLDIPVRLAAIAAGAWLAGQIGFSIWPSDWSFWAQLPLALVVGEFFMYWIHRLTHEIPFLWRFHAVHHSAPRLYFLNAARFHPVDITLSNFAPMIPLIILGADAQLIALFGLVSAVHGLFQHANLVLRLGPLNWIFSMAELHRWHHSPVLEESNTNYGQNLIVWDVVFGTRFLPKDREAPREIGLNGLSQFPMDYIGQLMSPFRWQEIERKSAVAASPARQTEKPSY